MKVEVINKYIDAKVFSIKEIRSILNCGEEGCKKVKL
jgi:hypothetical protein